jgi:flagellar biosynthesis chaperone FliJ
MGNEMTEILTGICILAIMLLLHIQGKEIATLKRQLKALQDSTLTFSNNMNEYMKNQNDISQMLSERIKKGY